MPAAVPTERHMSGPSSPPQPSLAPLPRVASLVNMNAPRAQCAEHISHARGPCTPFRSRVPSAGPGLLLGPLKPDQDGRIYTAQNSLLFWSPMVHLRSHCVCPCLCVQVGEALCLCVCMWACACVCVRVRLSVHACACTCVYPWMQLSGCVHVPLYLCAWCMHSGGAQRSCTGSV